MTAQELRQKFIEFFKEKSHVEVPGASLIPENDPSVLFTTAGMHPLVPFLLGEKHPQGQRLVNYQKCIRTGDIDEVGDLWHLTFFEMLGNWSLGDPQKPKGIGAGYWKEQAIEMSFEFLTAKKWLNISKNKLAISVFAGDKDAPFDQESYNIWFKLGIAKDKIYKYPKSENWWGPAGETGPCGPDTEMFYITNREPCGLDCQPSCNCGRYAEIWNDVFMEYNKTAQGKYVPLKQRNVDTGMGLERTIAILNGYDNVYQTELFQPIVEKVERLSGKKYSDFSRRHPRMSPTKSRVNVWRSIRIIVDHLRAATFIMGDDLGIAPSNVDQGYVVRKLIRRAIRHGRMIGIQENFSHKIGEVVINLIKNVYPELDKNRKFVIDNFQIEEEKFTKTLQQGLKELNKLFRIGKIGKIKEGKDLPIFNRVDAKKAFYIYQTYGFPLEMIQEELASRALMVDEREFSEEMKKHQELSRTATAGKFRCGLADESEMAKKYHTATHLLHAALRQVLGEHVLQKGSNINEKRLRFDFSHPEKMTADQIQQVEDMVNQIIQKNLLVKVEEMSVNQAKQKGAVGIFAHKYGNRVRVYSINDFSCEICGGPHVDRTGVLGKFKIKKEESSSAGVRRIKAVLE